MSLGKIMTLIALSILALAILSVSFVFLNAIPKPVLPTSTTTLSNGTATETLIQTQFQTRTFTTTTTESAIPNGSGFAIIHTHRAISTNDPTTSMQTTLIQSSSLPLRLYDDFYQLHRKCGNSHSY